MRTTAADVYIQRGVFVYVLITTVNPAKTAKLTYLPTYLLIEMPSELLTQVDS